MIAACLTGKVTSDASGAKRGLGCVLTVVVVDGLFHEAGLRRGNPQREAVLLDAEAEQVLRPVSHLQVGQTRKVKIATTHSKFITQRENDTMCDEGGPSRRSTARKIRSIDSKRLEERAHPLAPQRPYVGGRRISLALPCKIAPLHKYLQIHISVSPSSY